MRFTNRLRNAVPFFLAATIFLAFFKLATLPFASSAYAQDDTDAPPSVLDFGNMQDLHSRIVVSIAIHHAATSPDDYGTSLASYWGGAKAFFAANGQDLPPAAAVAILSVINAQPPTGHDRARDVPRDVENLLSLLVLGDWEDLGFSNEMFGGPPSPELRVALLSLLSAYAQATTNECYGLLAVQTGEPLTPDLTPKEAPENGS